MMPIGRFLKQTWYGIKVLSHTSHISQCSICIFHRFEQVIVLINIKIHIMFSVHCILIIIIMSRYHCSSRELTITHSHPNSNDCLSSLKSPIRYLNVIRFSQTQRLCDSLWVYIHSHLQLQKTTTCGRSTAT